MRTSSIRKAVINITRLLSTSVVPEHYGRGGELLNTILKELRKIGTLDKITIDDLAPMDEFHVGGREATKDFLERLNIFEKHHFSGTDKFGPIAQLYGLVSFSCL